ncbi:MAG: DUF2779 domain-containing protein [Candidatus Krumholzibacteria bacterium]|nr:DUF2779 domain-containing protein [Candidatus Krumholzibacteria bacterium]
MSDNKRNKISTLSKSRFMAGLQCQKRLYFECYNRDLANPVDEVLQAIFDTGTEVGELARGLYPEGLLIAEDYLHHEDSMRSTERALLDPSVPALFEAAFQYDDIRIRADILVRVGDGHFDLIEVKSTTKTKDEHIPDVGIQLYVLKGCGINVRNTYIGHLNNEYIYPGGAYDLDQLFRIEDVTGRTLTLVPEMPRLLAEMRLPLLSSEPPDIKIGKHCSKPYDCPFIGHCHDDLLEHHVAQLPWAGAKLLRSLDEAGIKDIRSIPADFPGLSTIQKRVRNCVVDNHFAMDSEIARTLKNLDYPIHFLDFETFNPALPLYPGTRPYQIITFQWSNHILEKNGRIRHEEFLHEGPDDPRELFTKSLLETLGTKGSIVVYSSFEASRIKGLAHAFPRLSHKLLDLINYRLVDLHKLIRQNCYHPLFHGSFSIKSVIPALVPGFNYGDLLINEGMMASLAYAEMRRPETVNERRDYLKEGLLSYCKRDTEAEVQLYQMLRNRSVV